MTRRCVICGNWHGCKLPAQRWNKWECTMEIVGRRGWELIEGWAMVTDVHISLHETWRRWSEITRSSQHGFVDYHRPLDVEASKNDFLHTPSSFPMDTLNIYSSSCRGPFIWRLQRLQRRIIRCAVWLWSRETSVSTGKTSKKRRARYTSTGSSLIAYMEKKEKDNVWTARCRAALDLWYGWLTSLMTWMTPSSIQCTLQGLKGITY